MVSDFLIFSSLTFFNLAGLLDAGAFDLGHLFPKATVLRLLPPLSPLFLWNKSPLFTI